MEDFETAFSKHIRAHMELLSEQILKRLKELAYKDLHSLSSEERDVVTNTKLFQLVGPK